MKTLIISFIFFLCNYSYDTLALTTRYKTSKTSEANKLAGLSDAELYKMMNDYGLDTKEVGSLVSEKLNAKSLKSKFKSKKDPQSDINIYDDPLRSLVEEDKKNMNSLAIISLNEIYYKNREILNHFDLSEDKIRTIIKASLSYPLFSRLPLPAMNILSEATIKESYQKYLPSRNKTNEMSMLISNTLNSKTFIDNENKICRKGMLTAVETEGNVRSTWAVLNNKVFSFFDSGNYLEIIKIYRVAMIYIKDLLYSPCFFIYYENCQTEFSNSQSLVCALNFKDKEYWLNTFYHHKEQYKILLTDKTESQNP